MEQEPENESGDELLIPEVSSPQDNGLVQKPTKDVPTGKGHILDAQVVVSENTPSDIQKALENSPEEPVE